MSLRELAAADNRVILEDTTGFGWAITVTAPDGTYADRTGFSNDISQVIDPQTGQAVPGRLASVALSIEALTDAALEMPRGIADGSLKLWTFEFDDIGGNSYVFKVLEAMPDRTLNCVTCTLEFYRFA